MCAENFVIYRAVEGRELRAVIPRRSSLPGEKSVLIVSAATHKQKNLFFVLLQVGRARARGFQGEGDDGGPARDGGQCGTHHLVHGMAWMAAPFPLWMGVMLVQYSGLPAPSLQAGVV